MIGKEMHKERTSYWVTIFFIMMIITPYQIYAQLETHLPDSLTIIIDGKIWQPSDGWLEQLKADSRSGSLKYQISGSYSSPSQNNTLLKLSPAYSIEDVISQVILYYSILEPADRVIEKVLVYPFFSPANASPFITCSCSNGGKFNFIIYKWQQIPLPQKPSLLEITIYNQIVNSSFSMMDNFGEISENLLKKIADEQDLSESEIKEIYKKVFLWQKGN